VKLSEPGLLVLLFFLFFNALLASSSEISPSNKSRSSIFTVGIGYLLPYLIFHNIKTALSVYKF
jgi:hypothetical protein